MPKKNTPAKDFNTVVDFIKSTSLEGLERIMMALVARNDGFTDDQYEQLQDLVDNDLSEKVNAKLSAAARTGVTETYETTIAPIVAACSFADVKRYTHAVDLRLQVLPAEQQDEIMVAIAPTGLQAILGGVGLPTDGNYGDPESWGDFADDDEATNPA